MSNAVAEKIEAPQVVPAQSLALTPMDMLDRAVASGASIETLERLIALKERWDANEARKAFNEAVAAVKSELKPVVKNKTGHNSKRYADFSAIAGAVDPLLSEHGLGYRFRTEQGERINVTCILFHRAGHSEQTTLSGPPDASGSKNAIQAIGSTLTYLQRYSLVQMLGIAVSDDDDGAAGRSGEAISEDQVIALRELIEATNSDQPKFLKFFKISSLAELPAGRYDEAAAMLKTKVKK